MLRAAIKAYYTHQQHRLPGSKLVDLGAYQLVHGERKMVVSPAYWLNLLAPEMEVEMSMIVHKRVNGAEYIQTTRKCPKCQILFERKSSAGWVTWYGYLNFAHFLLSESSPSCSAQFETNRRNVTRTQDSEKEVISPAV
jgi:hypothetical protein